MHADRRRATGMRSAQAHRPNPPPGIAPEESLVKVCAAVAAWELAVGAVVLAADVVLAAERRMTLRCA
jgi:hypothetical protein